MNKRTLFIAAMLLSATRMFADIDITDLYLTNASFDDDAHFDYRKGETGNVAQEILPIYGWTKDISVDYTITGVYEYGTGKTFNTNGIVPNSGYENSKGGCLALSTGWEQALCFYQEITLPKGKYKIQTTFYNGSNSTSGYSELAWKPTNGEANTSKLSSFPLNQWTIDEIGFTLSDETKGRVQIGFRAIAGGSANSAKVVADFVRLFLVGDDAALLNDMRTSLRETLSTAKELYADGNGKKSNELKNAIEASDKTSEDANSSYSEMYTSEVSLKDAIEKYRWANSTNGSPISFTNKIQNPSFEDGFEGWTQSGFKTQTNTSFAKKAGDVYVEKWVSNSSTVGNINVKQEIEGLPIGNYTLIASAQCLQDGEAASGAYIYGGDANIEVSGANDYILKFTNLEESQTIGFMTDGATGNWVATDNFRLYYYAASEDELAKEIESRVSISKVLLGKAMCGNHKQGLEAAINDANKWIETKKEETISQIAKNLKTATQTAMVSVSAFEKLETAIEEAKGLCGENGEGVGELSKAVKNAEAVYADDSQTIADINSATNELNTAILIYRTKNASGDMPKVENYPLYANGATMAFFRASFTGSDIVEQGFCWATHKNPTITDNRSTLSYDNNGAIYIIEGLNPASFYYVRPYAISKSYAVGYGETIKICTLPMGIISWQYNNGGSDEENARINNAVADAVDIWNNITSIKGLHLNVNYGAQTPTADCSYGGWMRVGPNASYQRTGTIQHEMCHAAGVGTTSSWYDNPTYRAETSKGIWLGERTDRVVQFLENDKSAHLKGDNTHFWPYGVNGAHEDNGTRMLYYANALIIQALGEDNLPPVSGAFASPAYTFTQDDDEYYYILPETLANSNTALLNGNANSSPSVANCDWKTALKDHSFAWQIKFNPETQLYDLRNIGADKSLSANSAKPILGEKSAFAIQMLGSRENVASQNFNMKSYWIVFANGTDQPNALSINGQSLAASKFDHRNTAASQRWILLSRKEVKALAGDYSKIRNAVSCNSSIVVNSAVGGIEIESAGGNLVMIYDVYGRLIKEFYAQAGVRLFIALPQGVYIVNGQKAVAK